MSKWTDFKEFYPTPEDISEEMFSLVNWNGVTRVLEPSAGNGTLIEFLERKLKYYSDPPSIFAIEINPALRAELKEKEISLCGEDFLQFKSFASFDVIFSNPPFSLGESHLRHAISLVENWGNGGQIVFLLNSETIDNPFSVGRKALIQKLNQYNAKVISLGAAFQNAERPTNVNVSMIYLRIPPKERKSFIFENYQEEKMIEESTFTPEELIQQNGLETVCKLFEREVEIGLRFLDECNSLIPYLTNEDRKPYFSVVFNEYGNNKCTKQSFVEKVRIKYWNRFLDNDEFARRLTGNMYHQYKERIYTEFKNYDFNMVNVATAKLEMSKNIIFGIKETILSLFEKCTHTHAWYSGCKNNIHYFDGWKTNNCYKVNKKIILPISAYPYNDSSWFRPSHYDVVRSIADIEKGLAFFDNDLPNNYDPVSVIDKAFLHAENIKQERNIQLRYFYVTFCKKGTCHIKFHNEEVLKRFNLFAAQSKNWLPPSYGKKAYQDMSAEEKAVIDSYEGEKSYTKVQKHPNEFMFYDQISLANPTNLLIGNRTEL